MPEGLSRVQTALSQCADSRTAPLMMPTIEYVCGKLPQSAPVLACRSSLSNAADCRQAVIERLKLPADVCPAVGVDRFDDTDGVLERLNAVERLLEKWPEWTSRLVFVQVAPPTRAALDEYRSFQERVQRVTERINQRFSQPGYQPVHLLATHHEHDAEVA